MIFAGALVGLLVGGLVADQVVNDVDTIEAAGPGLASSPQLEVNFEEDATEEVVPEWMENLDGNMALSTDYVWRGVTQTDSQIAVSGGMDYASESGLGVGVWASNVSGFATAEIDTWVEYEIEEIVPDIDLTAKFMYYGYAGEAKGTSDLDFWEVIGEATFQDTITGTIAFSPDFAGSDETSVYLGGGMSHEVSDGINVVGKVGFFQSDAFDDDSYFHYSVGANTSVGKWNLDLTFHASTLEDDDLTFGDAGEPRIVGTISASF